MKISHRLYLTVTPAILGVFLMGGLFYWGQYEHAAPEVVLLLGAVAVAASVVLAWANARVLARRIERLAGTVAPLSTAESDDELDRIAHGVDRLSTDIQVAEVDRVTKEQAQERRTHDYAKLLESIGQETAKRLEEVRLPLHILLENHFGDLNENQEEMLGAARTAAEAIDADLVNLQQIAELDLGDHSLRRDRIKPSEFIEALRPMLVAAAESVGATIEVDLAPLLPAMIGDRARLQDALATILGDAVRSSASGSRVQLSVDQRETKLVIDMKGIGRPASSIRSAAGARVIQVHDGTVEQHAQGVTVVLPLESRGQSSVAR